MCVFRYELTCTQAASLWARVSEETTWKIALNRILSQKSQTFSEIVRECAEALHRCRNWNLVAINQTAYYKMSVFQRHPETSIDIKYKRIMRLDIASKTSHTRRDLT